MKRSSCVAAAFKCRMHRTFLHTDSASAGIQHGAEVCLRGESAWYRRAARPQRHANLPYCHPWPLLLHDACKAPGQQRKARNCSSVQIQWHHFVIPASTLTNSLASRPFSQSGHLGSSAACCASSRKLAGNWQCGHCVQSSCCMRLPVTMQKGTLAWHAAQLRSYAPPAAWQKQHAMPSSGASGSLLGLRTCKSAACH